MKTYILVFVSILSFSVSGKSQESNYSYTESYEVEQPLTLTISSDSRNIEVIAHNESSIVVFYIVKKNNTLLKLSKEKIENGFDNQWKTNVKHTQSTLKIEVSEASEEKNKNLRDKITIDLKILVPEQTSTFLRSSDGDILLKGLSLDQACEARDGNIKLVNLKGKVSATALDGDIFLDNFTGILDSHTPDGRVVQIGDNNN